MVASSRVRAEGMEAEEEVGWDSRGWGEGGGGEPRSFIS